MVAKFEQGMRKCRVRPPPVTRFIIFHFRASRNKLLTFGLSKIQIRTLGAKAICNSERSEGNVCRNFARMCCHSICGQSVISSFAYRFIVRRSCKLWAGPSRWKPDRQCRFFVIAARSGSRPKCWTWKWPSGRRYVAKKRTENSKKLTLLPSSHQIPPVPPLWSKADSRTLR
jgi:hypothetical protein